MPENSSLVQEGRSTLKWAAKGFWRRSRDHRPPEEGFVEGREEEEQEEGEPWHLREQS